MKSDVMDAMLLHPDAYLKAKARLNEQFAAAMRKPPIETFYAAHPFLNTLSQPIVQKFYDCLWPRVVEPQAAIVSAGEKVRWEKS